MPSDPLKKSRHLIGPNIARKQEKDKQMSSDSLEKTREPLRKSHVSDRSNSLLFQDKKLSSDTLKKSRHPIDPNIATKQERDTQMSSDSLKKAREPLRKSHLSDRFNSLLYQDKKLSSDPLNKSKHPIDPNIASKQEKDKHMSSDFLEKSRKPLRKFHVSDRSNSLLFQDKKLSSDPLKKLREPLRKSCAFPRSTSFLFQEKEDHNIRNEFENLYYGIPEILDSTLLSIYNERKDRPQVQNTRARTWKMKGNNVNFKFRHSLPKKSLHIMSQQQKILPTDGKSLDIESSFVQSNPQPLVTHKSEKDPANIIADHLWNVRTIQKTVGVSLARPCEEYSNDCDIEESDLKLWDRMLQPEDYMTKTLRLTEPIMKAIDSVVCSDIENSNHLDEVYSFESIHDCTTNDTFDRRYFDRIKKKENKRKGRLRSTDAKRKEHNIEFRDDVPSFTTNDGANFSRWFSCGRS